MRPRKWGGLDIKDLDKFGRALRLRWLWHGWDEQNRPWKNLLKTRDVTDRNLFFSSTYIIVGDGRNTPFWEANWLNGAAPKALAPNLYQRARFKHRTVHKEMENLNWIRNLQDLNSQTLLDEFTLLYAALSTITLTNERDRIIWRWTANGEYSASSAYEVQFYGAMNMFPVGTLWTAKTEPKCKFFAWLALHGKAQTADNLVKKSYPCNPICALCYCMEETADHILSQCNFTEAAWCELAELIQPPNEVKVINRNGVGAWLNSITASQDK